MAGTRRAGAALISGNWKMHENHFEALKLISELAAILRANPLPKGREVSVHPPFTSLRTVQTAIETDHVPLQLGAQNCFYEDRGAYTGEVSPEMLAKLGVALVIAGHSERRRLLGEPDEVVRKKVDAIFRNGMRPILCVGESAEERAGGRAQEIVSGQLASCLEGRSSEQVSSLVVAYEPVWAIGTGETATAEDAGEMCSFIRAELRGRFGPAADECRIQYGGSVTPENAASLLGAKEVDGLLVGGSSLDATKFAQIASA